MQTNNYHKRLAVIYDKLARLDKERLNTEVELHSLIKEIVYQLQIESDRAVSLAIFSKKKKAVSKPEDVKLPKDWGKMK